jgi:hypothetical protein
MFDHAVRALNTECRIVHRRHCDRAASHLNWNQRASKGIGLAAESTAVNGDAIAPLL